MHCVWWLQYRILFQMFEMQLELISRIDFLVSDICKSLINIPIRKTSSPATCIDHIYIKFTACIKSGVLGTDLSDHEAIFCSLKVDTLRVQNSEIIQVIRWTHLNKIYLKPSSHSMHSITFPPKINMNCWIK